MPKPRTGYVAFNPNRKYWEARLGWTDQTGKRCDRRRRVNNKTEGHELLKTWNRELDAQGESAFAGERLTFAQLAQQYSERRLIPAEYQGEKRIKGLRSVACKQQNVTTLVSYFGRQRVRSITHQHIEDFKNERLSTPKRNGQPRKISSVNREMEELRAMLNFACQQSYLARNPFTLGSPLIDKSAENNRDRILTPDEEQRLLAACDVPARAHLKPILICALDTAMRRGEIFKLEWRDVDLDNRLIRLRATTTKTLKTRTIGITQRLFDVLTGLRSQAPPDQTARVFGITYDLKHSFATAKKLAGLEDLHFHDLRHCAATAIAKSGVASAFAMKVTGHTQERTFRRYVNADAEAARLIAETLDQQAERRTEQASIQMNMPA